jgi:hypothetical protein
MDEGRSETGGRLMSGGPRLVPEERAAMDFDTMVARFNREDGLVARHEAMMELRAQGEVAKPLLFAGLEHPAWRVRYVCLRVLDHTIVDDETRVRVLDSLRDPHRKVRRAALHLLGCEPCKPEGFCGIEGIDIDGLYLDVLDHDRSALVRLNAVSLFLYKSSLSERVVERLRRALAVEQNDAVRLRIARALTWPQVFGGSDGATRYVDRRDEYNARVEQQLLLSIPA